jgi:predicted Zn-dependent protease
MIVVTLGLARLVPWLRQAPARRHLNAGIDYVQQRDVQAAEREFWAAIRADPHYLPPYRMLADFYLASEQWTKAADLLRRFRTVAPHEPHLTCQLAEAQFHLGQYDEARAHVRRELSHDKNCGKAHFVLGRLMIQDQNERDAVEHLTAALRLLPDEPDVAVYLAQAYIENMSLENGQRVLMELLRKQPDNAHAHYMLGFCYARNVAEPDHERKAEEQLNEALRLHPNHSGAHFELGRLLRLRGQPAQAVSHLETAARLNPHYPPTFYNLAQAYRRLHQPDKARAAQKKFEALNRLEIERSTQARRAAARPNESMGQRVNESMPLTHLSIDPLTRTQGGLFTDVAQSAGIRFLHSHGGTGRKYFLETTGSGCAFFDFNNDGWLDALLLQAGPVPGTAERAPWDREKQPRNRLYRNQGDGTFADVTEGSGLENTGCSQGVAVGDYDNDGYEDLYITAYGGNFLFHNERGSGRFSDVTRRAGVANTEQGPRWSLSAAFIDYDNDSFLDLFVTHYCQWTPQTDKACYDARGNRSYCHPQVYDGDTMTLYHNNRNGTFSDVTKSAGIAGLVGRGMGVAALDYNQDGREDLYVTGDLTPNFLLRNNGNGTFTDVALEAGAAFSDSGQPLSGMGVGVGDFDNNGFEDLFVTNFSKQGNSLYRNTGRGVFDNVTFPSGVGNISLPFLGFGCEFLDYDLDGHKDILVANGHVMDNVELTERGVTYAQRKSLYRNNGNGTFTDVTRGVGDLLTRRVSRGLAVGDFDNDGDLDVLVNNQNDRAQLLRNNREEGNHWIAFQTVGVKSNRDGKHTKITVRVGKRKMFSEVRSGSSFCSHSDRRVYFGLGKSRGVDEVQVRWLSGVTETFRPLAADRLYVLTERKGVQEKRIPPPKLLDKRRAGVP